MDKQRLLRAVLLWCGPWLQGLLRASSLAAANPSNSHAHRAFSITASITPFITPSGIRHAHTRQLLARARSSRSRQKRWPGGEREDSRRMHSFVPSSPGVRRRGL